jgi:hypothetical protein
MQTLLFSIIIGQSVQKQILNLFQQRIAIKKEYFLTIIVYDLRPGLCTQYTCIT